MSISWDAILVRAGDAAAVTELLLATPERERRAFGPELLARVKALSDADLWQAHPRPGPVIALAAIGCLPSPAQAATVLGRRWVREWPCIPVPEFLTIARARQLDWLGDLGLRLAERVGAGAGGPRAAEWALVDALLVEGGVRPPITRSFVQGWIRTLPEGLTAGLRDSPWLDVALPAVFELDGMGSELPEPGFAEAVVQLIAEGRLDRATILDATIDRQLRGDRPAFLRPFTQLHDRLAPTVDEVAARASDYARLIGSAPSPIAGSAQRALRAADEAGRLDPDVLLAASTEVLTRKEKALVRAQLSWLERVAAREPARSDEIAGTIAIGFEHRSLDVQEWALEAIGHLVSRLSPATRAAILKAAGSLSGALPARATTLLSPRSGTGPPEATPPRPALPGSALLGTHAGEPRAAAMPPPFQRPAELAEEFLALIHDQTAIGWERVLAALVALGSRGDRTAIAEALGPVLTRHTDLLSGYGWSRLLFLGEATRAILDGAEGPMSGRVRWEAVYAGDDASLIHMPDDVLKLRIAEVAQRWTAAPVPILLATPTHVDGSLDAGVLADRLARAETEGWEPWPLDYEQALLRVVVDPAVVPRAERLTSGRGRQFAEWLSTGGLPEPVSTRFEQRGSALIRVVANLDPARSDGPGLILENALCTLSRSPRPGWSGGHDFTPDILAMVLPRNREVAAAWTLPAFAALADQDCRDASLLPLLADAAGPIGPAMALALVYALAARHEPDRFAAVDAFLALAGRPEPFAEAVGAELGALGRDGVIKLPRVAVALADALRAGATTPVWVTLAAALPIMLPAAPRGLPDLLEVATQAAGAVHARTDLPELTAIADRKGGSRLIREARRLREVLGG
ncbi:DUF6493 family protein [Actinoplanes regularis]|uniref:Secreted protein n=1 Tax=Actinoplanes regularis TaxID=52697 RepID=A0A238ZHS2_9ACTN|nr:DUF6493 family protein [Actinoplanes regularis]GIE87692.1 hypothetical protein Are01nite_41720 [Actinoplanes regularis]SNR82770.1 hypothetical protein SAMN06264365_10632 [Actinoplanes regularis]